MNLVNKKELIEADLHALKKFIYSKLREPATNIQVKKPLPDTNSSGRQGIEINTIIKGMKLEIDDVNAQNMTGRRNQLHYP